MGHPVLDLIASAARLHEFVALPLAATLLVFIFFTTTYTDRISTLKYVRLALAIPCCILCYAVAYPQGPYERGTYPAWFTVGGYGILKTLDVCLVGFRDAPQDVPRWVQLKWDDVGKEEEDGGEGSHGRVPLALPKTSSGRLAFAVDSLFSVRGGSFFKDRAFNWAPKEVYAYHPTPGYLNFLGRRLWILLRDILSFDIQETILNSYPFDTTSPHPLTSIPSATRQIVYTLAVGTSIFSSTFIPTYMNTTILVPLLRLRPEKWVPFWGNPLAAHSLAELWTVHWHGTFRRVFHRLSLPFTQAVQPYLSPFTTKMFRTFLIFGMSAIIHVCIPLGIPKDDRHRIVFFDWATLKFFALLQPLGLLIEATIVHPATEPLPGRWKVVVRRVYLWSWLVWTGRWYSDGYLLIGVFDKQNLPFSPFRALLNVVGVRL